MNCDQAKIVITWLGSFHSSTIFISYCAFGLTFISEFSKLKVFNSLKDCKFFIEKNKMFWWDEIKKCIEKRQKKVEQNGK